MSIWLLLYVPVHDGLVSITCTRKIIAPLIGLIYLGCYLQLVIYFRIYRQWCCITSITYIDCYPSCYVNSEGKTSSCFIGTSVKTLSVLILQVGPAVTLLHRNVRVKRNTPPFPFRTPQLCCNDYSAICSILFI